MTDLARIEDHGDHLVVVNANPTKRNALTPDYYDVLGRALEQADHSDRICSVILRGEQGFFCAGGDLAMLATRRTLPRPERLAKVDELHDLIRAILACRKPVIAAVEGGAAGAGASIAFACDMIVAAQDAKFTIAYVKAGLVPDGGLTKTLSQCLPRATVMQMALLGQPVSAQRLYDLGAVSQIVPADQVMAAAVSLANALANGPQQAQTMIKTLVNAAGDTPVAAQLDAERNAMVDAVVAPEASEGIDAFLSKRSPDFRKLRS